MAILLNCHGGNFYSMLIGLPEDENELILQTNLLQRMLNCEISKNFGKVHTPLWKVC